MNKAVSLFTLVKSLTKAEKRYFRLSARLQEGEKRYLFLFNRMDMASSVEEACRSFGDAYPGSSLEMAVKYLYAELLDCLLRLRDKQDVQTEIMNDLSKAGILFAREMPEEGFSLLNKAKQLATVYEQDLLLLLVRRTELIQFGAFGFKGLNEQELVHKQMKLNEGLKYSRQINQHLQLYDVLRYRLTSKGYTRSDKQKKELNDLVLSELYLVANQAGNGFEGRKLHLLFQAAYYLHTGNFKSAIRHYRDLIGLLEANQQLLSHPPVYYLSAIQGILDSLQISGLQEEMPFFLSKLNELEAGNYPAEFIRHVHILHFLYIQSSLLQSGRIEEAARRLEQHEVLLRKASLLGLDEQLRLLLSAVKTNLCLDDLAQARRWMTRILGAGKMFHSLPDFRMARLLNLLIQAEVKNEEFLVSEIQSIKRSIRFEKKEYKTESLLFKFLVMYVRGMALERLELMVRKVGDPIRRDKYERQLLKSFDFLSWMESRLTGCSFAETLRKNAIR